MLQRASISWAIPIQQRTSISDAVPVAIKPHENGCVETIPCDCRYKLEESDFRNTLALTRTDQPALSYRVDLGVYQTADVRLEEPAALTSPTSRWRLPATTQAKCSSTTC